VTKRNRLSLKHALTPAEQVIIHSQVAEVRRGKALHHLALNRPSKGKEGVPQRSMEEPALRGGATKSLHETK